MDDHHTCMASPDTHTADIRPDRQTDITKEEAAWRWDYLSRLFVRIMLTTLGFGAICYALGYGVGSGVLV